MNLSLKIFYHIKTVMQNAQQQLFCSLQGGGALWRTGLAKIATLEEFDENDRFFPTSCDLYVGHILRVLYTFHPKKHTKDGF
jgi:hypothetical protein